MKKLKQEFLKLERFKKKEKPPKVAKPKVVTKKQADLMTLSIMGLIVVIFLSGVIRMFTMLRTVDNLESDIFTLRADIRNATSQDHQLDIILATYVLDEFVPLWMNVDLSNDGHRDALSQFISFDLSTIHDGMQPDTTRVLNEFELLSMREMGRFNLATYAVSYDVNEREMNVALHVPFLIVDGKVSVISLPYFTQIESAMVALDIPQMYIENDVSEDMLQTRQEVEEFLPVFFDMYAQSDERSLALFMDTPVLMGGNFELEAVQLSDAQMAFVGRDVMVQVMVTFRDVGTDFSHLAPFTLRLESQANSWFVREMHHLFIN